MAEVHHHGGGRVAIHPPGTSERHRGLHRQLRRGIRHQPVRGRPWAAQAYSGQNAYSEWPPPPDHDTSVLLLGYEGSEAAPYFTDCATLARIDNGDHLDNQEQGIPVLLCRVPRPWSAIWRDVRHYD